ncbi:hypothetical protein V6N12_027708 [Hibiscus sabdariffa]|uniref:Uncharacterized protein n=1 Tax=Hibiscus sabdariffa TaxID=183260 RepID=A0ABR2F3P9_9ROSI
MAESRANHTDHNAAAKQDLRALEDVCSMGLVEMEGNCSWDQKVDQLNNFQLVDSIVPGAGNELNLEEGLMDKNLLFDNSVKEPEI